MILDTNALSAFMDGAVDLEPIVRSTRELALPVIVFGEYRYGLLKSNRRSEYEERLRRMLGKFALLEITQVTADWYAAIRLDLQKIVRPIPANDAWIAALARQHDKPLLTRDAHFDLVPGLNRIGW